MLKWFLFNAGLFWVVSYLGKLNNVHCGLLAVIFAVLHHLLHGYVRTLEYFLPDSKVLPPCPGDSERGSNGLDCKSKGDVYGL